jgi:signal transduction histidine kinase
MKLSLRNRLALSYLVVILIGMGIIAPLSWLAVERLYLNTQRASLLAQAQLVAAALGGEEISATATEPYSQTTNTLPGIHTRVIDAQGGVVIDLTGSGQPTAAGGLALPQLAQNEAGLVTPAELIDRPEIAQALNGQPGSATRWVAAAGGRQVLYAAVPVLSESGDVVQIVYLATPLPDTRWSALPLALRWQLVGVLLVALLLSGAAGWILARQISRPLTRMVDAAHAVAAGDLTQKVPEDAAIIEVDGLGKAFNAMTSSLRRSDQAKTAFISDVSHELRTPLTVIKGTIETLQDGALDDLPGREPLLTSMSRETERMIRLVNDLLVLTRADAGALNLQLSAVDLSRLARARCEYLEFAASRRGIRLVVDNGDERDEMDAFVVSADADRIAQVLDNLLDNAIRYSPQGCEVQVSVYRDAGMVACRVEDSGPGIPTRHLPFIFERFYRADPSRGRGNTGAGSGLGLAIVRGLVEAHGGRVAASSLEGKGTSVTFWLPEINT